MQRVGAALRDDVDIAAEGAAEFGLAAACHHLKLLDGVDAERIPLSPAASSLADTPSTMKLLERLRWLAIESPCREPRRFRRRAVCCSCSSATRRARAAPGREIAAVHRQVLDLRLWNGARDPAARRLEHLAVSDDGHGSVNAGDFEVIEMSNAEPALKANVRALSLNPWSLALSSYGPIFR